MITFLHFCVILYIFSQCLGQDCVLDRTQEKSMEQKIFEDISPIYTGIEYPLKNCNDKITVGLQFSIIYFHFNNKELVVHSWVHLSWYDPRLKWDPSKYDNTNQIVNSYLIWTPSLKVHNSNDVTDWLFYNSCTYSITSDGHVKCTQIATLKTTCRAKVKEWPFDTQKCVLEFGESTTKVGSRFTYNGSHGIDFIYSKYGREWKIIGTEKSENQTGEVHLSFTLELERRAHSISALVVVPYFIVFVLTTTSLVLNTTDGVRFAIACFSLFMHFNILSILGDIMPKYSVDIPVLLFLVRDSIGLNTFALILTLVLIVIRRRKTPPPIFIRSLNAYTFNSSFKYLIRPRWEIEGVCTDEPSGKRSSLEEWTDFASLVNSVSLGGVMIAYIILFSVYIPKPSP